MNYRKFLRDALNTIGLLRIVRQLLGRQADGTPKPRVHARPSHFDGGVEAATPQPTVAKPAEDKAYGDRVAAERLTFSTMVNVHDLPPIYHYWSNKYLLPAWKQFGFTCPDSFFCLHLVAQLQQNSNSLTRFLSIGAGNCDTEVRLAKMLIEKGFSNFTIECLDLNEEMLARGRTLSKAEGLTAHIKTTATDLNKWVPEHTYDAVIANQSLHHIEQLETVFSTVRQAIGSSGVFLTSDMIGRNGHMRWPEALEIVHEFWKELPPSYRFNLQLNRHEEMYQNWDCSNYGFEGIRAQDVLPLLMKDFHFQDFFAFANVIDPFIDRGFGHHFDPTKDWDRDFIDRVQNRDAAEMESGNLHPTHLLAAMRAIPTTLERYIPPFTPEFSCR